VSSGDTELTELRPQVSSIPLPDISGYLLHGEEIAYIDRQHPIVLVGPVLGVLAVLAVAGVLVSASGAGMMVGLFGWIFAAAVVALLVRVLLWARTVLVISNRRVFEYRSLIVKGAAIKPVFRQGILFRQGPIGRSLNYGTIITRSPTGDPIHVFRWIHNPRAFYQALTDQAH
jgi:hypothetical protein